jgi:hypothetical protein
VKEWPTPGGLTPGEGATFFLLARPGAHTRRLGQLRSAGARDLHPDLVCIDRDGLWSAGAGVAARYQDCPAGCYNAVWGGFPSGSGVALAACLSLLGTGEARRILLHTHRPAPNRYG